MLTYDAVAKAAQTIQARGQRPSLTLILAETGGSKTDVSRFFRQWREEEATKTLVPPPPELAAIEQLSPDLAIRLRKAFEERGRAEIEQAQEARRAAEAHVDELQRIVGDQAAEIELLRQQVANQQDSEQRIKDQVTAAAATTAERIGNLVDVVANMQREVSESQQRILLAQERAQEIQSDMGQELEIAHDDMRIMVHELEANIAASTSLHASTIRSAMAQQMHGIKEIVNEQNERSAERLRIVLLRMLNENRSLSMRIMATEPHRQAMAKIKRMRQKALDELTDQAQVFGMY